jgi:hypothetical protein
MDNPTESEGKLYTQKPEKLQIAHEGYQSKNQVVTMKNNNKLYCGSLNDFEYSFRNIEMSLTLPITDREEKMKFQ